MPRSKESEEAHKNLKKVNAELEERQQQLRAEAAQRVKAAADLQKYKIIANAHADIQDLSRNDNARFEGITADDWYGFDMVMYRYLEVLCADLLAEHGDLLSRVVGSEQQSA